MFFGCYPQLIVEGVVPDLVETKAREAQQIPQGSEEYPTGLCILEEGSQVLHRTG